jgi:DNA polymerase III sliding clamp (beta) subunit (PCNA family)
MISIQSASLKEALKRVGPSVDRRSQITAFQSVRVRVDGEAFEMIAAGMNGQASYREDRLGNPNETMDICVSAERLAPLLNVSGDWIDVALQKNSRAKFSTAGYAVTVPMLPGDALPFTKSEGNPVAEFDVVGLTDLILSVAFAANDKDIREFCRGVWLESDGSQLTATATNGNMLATAQVTTAAPTFSVLLPTHSAELLAELDATHLVISASHVTASRDKAELVLKPLTTKPINWRATLPAPKNAITFHAPLLREAVSMHRFYGDKMGSVQFTSEGSECSIEIKSQDNEATIDLDAEDIVGDEPFNFTFRGDQLTKLLTRAPVDTVTFYWDAANPRAFLVQNGNWRGVVSPLKA